MDIQYYKDNQKTRFFAEQYEQLLNRKADSLKMSETEEDPSMKEMALQESVELQDQADQMKKQMDEILEEEKAEDDFPNEIILEVRAGAGGDEASIFAYQLAEMYTRYSEKKGWQVSKVSESTSEAGGYKEATFEIHGKGVYKALRFETPCIPKNSLYMVSYVLDTSLLKSLSRLKFNSCTFLNSLRVKNESTLIPRILAFTLLNCSR
jgi:peptide chain release factor 1